MALIVLGIILGALVFVVALMLRKRGCALLALPFPLLILVWFILASVPPDAASECERLFGKDVRHVASDIRCLKPTFMDGHLLSFHMPTSNYRMLLDSGLSTQLVGGLHFFLRVERPADWPPILETMEECLQRDIGEDRLMVYFDWKTETVYSAYHYESW